jgi:hypothetical protein
MIKYVLFIFIVSSSISSWAEDRPLKVIKDYHSSILDSVGDFFADEFYSSKKETLKPSQRYNARLGRGPGDLCYQMRYDRKKLTYKLSNGEILNLSRESYYDGNTSYKDCVINEKFACTRFYFVGDSFYCTDHDVKGGVRILDMNLNEKKPDRIKNCGLRPIIQKYKNKVFFSIKKFNTRQVGRTYEQDYLPKVNLKRTLTHGKCEIEVENKLLSEKEEKIFNQAKTHIIGVARVGSYKCFISGGDIDLGVDVSCNSITFTGEAVKCHNGTLTKLLRFTKDCLDNSGETILSGENKAIQNTARKQQIPEYSNKNKNRTRNIEK